MQAKPFVNRTEVLPCKHLEGRDDALAGEIFDSLDRAGLGDLYLKGALAKAEAESFTDVLLHFGFEYNIVTGDAQVDVAFTDEGWDVGGWEEDTVARVS